MKKILIIVIVIIIASVIVGAFALKSISTPERGLEDENSAESAEEDSSSPDESEVEPEDVDSLKNIAASINGFGLDLFTTIAEEENTFISPYSIHTALLLAYIGADGQTAEEMRQVLGVENSDLEEVKNDAYQLKNFLEDNSSETEISIANALFLKETIPFLDSYKEDGAQYFDAEITALPETGERINEWVASKTDQKIDQIIDNGLISSDVIAYLVNAIYFKGNWAEKFQFPKENTHLATFHGKKNEAEVDMMETTGIYKHYSQDDLQAITIEYENGDYLFHAFMPLEESLSDFYGKLDHELFNLIKPTDKGDITLRLPKFTFENDLKLSTVLQDLGIVQALSPLEAKFSKMIDLEKLVGNVFISEVFHSSFIAVDEKGSEAAAATAVEMLVTSAPIEMPIIEFNHPFCFVIEEADTGTILFIGQVVNPTDL